MKSIVLTITETSDDEWEVDLKAKEIKTKFETIQRIGIARDRMIYDLALEEVKEDSK
jgi:hypothetical protein